MSMKILSMPRCTVNVVSIRSWIKKVNRYATCSGKRRGAIYKLPIFSWLPFCTYTQMTKMPINEFWKLTAGIIRIPFISRFPPGHFLRKPPLRKNWSSWKLSTSRPEKRNTGQRSRSTCPGTLLLVQRYWPMEISKPMDHPAGRIICFLPSLMVSFMLSTSRPVSIRLTSSELSLTTTRTIIFPHSLPSTPDPVGKPISTSLFHNWSIKIFLQKNNVLSSDGPAWWTRCIKSMITVNGLFSLPLCALSVVTFITLIAYSQLLSSWVLCPPERLRSLSQSDPCSSLRRYRSLTWTPVRCRHYLPCSLPSGMFPLYLTSTTIRIYRISCSSTWRELSMTVMADKKGRALSAKKSKLRKYTHRLLFVARKRPSATTML